jgi:4-amino-4-deoxy-L-arabinose transferase-like glycosyltransferase
VNKAGSALEKWGILPALILTLLSGITALKQPAYGDAQAYMIPNAQTMAATSFYPFIEGEVHPPLYFLIEAVAFRFLGERVEVAHALILFFAVVTVLATYALGTSLGGPLMGSVAALLVASWPPFLIQTRLIRLSIPLAAFSTLSLLSLQRGWAVFYVLFGACAALTKAPGILISGAAAVLGSLGLIRPRIAKRVLWVPVILYAAWLVACKLHYGWFLYPENVADFRFSVAGILDGWSFWMKRLLMDQSAWILVMLAILFLAREGYRYLLPPLVLGILGAVTPGLSFLGTVSVGLFCTLFWYAWREAESWRLFAVVPLLFTLLFSPYHYQFPRYLVPAWPAMTLILTRIIVTRRLGLVVIPVFAGLLIWSATMKTWHGWQHHECNANADDFVTGRKEAAQYLEINADQKLIIARKPADDLTNTAFGYVSKPLRVLREGNLRRLRCGGIRRAHYYYQLPTQSGRSEEWMSDLMRSCRTRPEVVFGKTFLLRSKSNEKIVIYRLHHRRPRPPS